MLQNCWRKNSLQSQAKGESLDRRRSMNFSATSGSFLPKSILCLRAYSLRKFSADLVAGVTVGLVALPLAMAFAISSGLTPQSGIYCAVVAGFLISALGGSSTQIGGPTGAFVVVVAGIVAQHGVDGLFLCTLMAGVFLMLLGLTGLGTAVKYIPRPVVIGFTNGIAVLIASTQIKDFFGIQIDKVPGEFLARIESLARHWNTLSGTATLMSCGTLAMLIILMCYAKRVPGAILALFGGTAIAWGFHLGLETIETRFGGIPSGLPHLVMPNFRPELILPLLSPALTVAMLGAIESLLSAVVADRMSGDKHNPNVELFAQGVANIASPLFGGLPATGAIARTATNIRSGARTPVAGMIHALTLLLVLLFAAPLAKHIPLCVLSAILMIVAYNMGEWREIPGILKLSKADIAVWLITFTPNRAGGSHRGGGSRDDSRRAALYSQGHDDIIGFAGDAGVRQGRLCAQSSDKRDSRGSRRLPDSWTLPVRRHRQAVHHR